MRKLILLLLGIFVWSFNFATPSQIKENRQAGMATTTLAAGCDTVTSFFIDTISCTWSTFNWDSVKNASSYVFKIRDADKSGSPYVAYYTKSTHLFVDGLLEATDYCAIVAAVCKAGDTSAYTVEQCWQQNYTDCIQTTVGTIPSDAFTIFPNPSTGNLKIKYKASAGEPVQITVRNTVGEVVYQISPVSSEGINEQSISLKKRGLYIVQINFTKKTYETTVVIE